MNRTGLALAGWCAALLAGAARPGAAQSTIDFGLYGLGVAATHGESAFAEAGSQQLARLRLMAGARPGAMRLDVAWEHLGLRTPGSGDGLGLLPGIPVGDGTDWLDLGGTVHAGARTRWTHRFDRMSVSWEGDAFSVTVGRQTISWATTLFLTPADPFAPFDPSDPFREYRGGVDAARLRVFPGPFTELELVVRGAGTPDGDRATVVGRAQTSRGGWAFGGWGGWVHERPSGAVFASGSLGDAGLRAEARVLDRDGPGAAAARVAVGVDRRLSWGARDVYLIAEVQYDGLGAPDSSDLLEVATSNAFQRGELQALSRWSTMVQASLQLHPLVAVDALALVSLSDGSMLAAPGVSWSASPSLSARGGAYFGLGAALGAGGLPGSEYGAVPNVGYLSLSWFR